MNPFFDLSEGALAKSLCDSIATNYGLLLLLWSDLGRRQIRQKFGTARFQFLNSFVFDPDLAFTKWTWQRHSEQLLHHCIQRRSLLFCKVHFKYS